MKISKPENIDFNSFSSIIFDWGGVITNIDFEATIKAFHSLGHPSMHKYLENKHTRDLFLHFEKGLVEPGEIFKRLLEDIGHDVPAESMKEALCAMILDTPPLRIEILNNLRNSYKIFLLSNTNVVHTTFFKEKMNIDFSMIFNKVYYSNEMGMRKPDAEIFKYVLRDAHLKPGETLFIDDSEMNINAADKLGLQVLLMEPHYSLEKIFDLWLPTSMQIIE